MTDISKCIIDVTTKFGFMDKTEAERVGNRLLEIESSFAGDPVGYRAAYKELVSTMSDDFQFKTKFLMKQAIKESKLMQRIAGDLDPSTLNKESISKLVARAKDAIEGENSVYNRSQVHSSVYDSFIEDRIRSSDLADVAKTGELDAQVSNLVEGIDEDAVRATLPDGPIGDEAFKKAKQYAEIVKQFNIIQYMDLRAAGTNVKYLSAYLVRRSTDITKLYADGINGYLDFLVGDGDGILDLERTFGFDLSKKDLDEALKDAKSILSEHYEDTLSKQDTFNDTELGYKIPPYMHKLKSRKLIFKKGKEWEYLSKYGHDGTLLNKLTSTARSNAKTAAISGYLGEAQVTFDRIKSKVAKNLDPDTRGYFNEQWDKKVNPALTNFVAPHATPDYKLDRGQQLARNLSKILTSLQTAKLGSSLFMGFLDPAQSALETFRYTGSVSQGMGEFVNANANLVKNFVDFGGQHLKKALGLATDHDLFEYFANDLGVAHSIDTTLLQAVGIEVDSIKSELFNKYIQGVSKITLLPLQTQASMYHSSRVSSRLLKTIVMNESPNEFNKQLFKNFGFSDADVNVLREVSKGLDKDDVLTRSAILSSDLDFAANAYGVTKEAAFTKVRELTNLFSTYINASSRRRTPLSSLREKRILFKGGDIHNEYLRLISRLSTQFLDTPMKILLDNMQAFSEIKANGGGAGVMKAASVLGLTSVSAYILQDELKSALLNKKSKMQAIQEGDKAAAIDMASDYARRALPIPLVFDSLISIVEPNKYSDPLLVNFLGPSGSILSDLKSAGQSFYSGGVDKGLQSLGKVGTRNLFPTSNFMLRGAIRHNLDYDIMTLKKVKRKDRNRLRK